MTMTMSSLLEEHGERQVFWFFKFLNFYEFFSHKDIYICIRVLILSMFKNADIHTYKSFNPLNV